MTVDSIKKKLSYTNENLIFKNKIESNLYIVIIIIYYFVISTMRIGILYTYLKQKYVLRVSKCNNTKLFDKMYERKKFFWYIRQIGKNIIYIILMCEKTFVPRLLTNVNGRSINSGSVVSAAMTVVELQVGNNDIIKCEFLITPPVSSIAINVL